jgi:hypothetical protein
MMAARNIGLWFLSVLLSISLFSLWFGGIEDVSLKRWLFVFRITMKFALPVACLYLPIVITKRDAEKGRMGVIAGWGLAIGPLSIVVWTLIAAMMGEPYVIEGDPATHFGLVASLVCAFIVGSLTTILYITALKLAHHLTRASKQAV